MFYFMIRDRGKCYNYFGLCFIAPKLMFPRFTMRNGNRRTVCAPFCCPDSLIFCRLPTPQSYGILILGEHIPLHLAITVIFERL